MASDTNSPSSEARDDLDWEMRLRYWKRKLGRLRLGVEPIEEQVERYRRVTVVLTAVVLGLALIFLALFTAFQRPDVGAILALVLLGPVVAFAWLDFALLRARATGFARELRDHEDHRYPHEETQTPGGA
jgi:hypothetical protein